MTQLPLWSIERDVSLSGRPGWTPPGPLDALAARRDIVQVVIDVFEAKASHRRPLPCLHDATGDIANRMKRVIVTVAAYERPVPVDVNVIPQVRARESRRDLGRLLGSKGADVGHLIAPRVERFHVDAIDPRNLPHVPECSDLVGGGGQLDDLEFRQRSLVSTADAQFEESLDILRGFRKAGLPAYVFICLRSGPIHTQVDRSQSRIEYGLAHLGGEQDGVGRDLGMQPALTTIGDHLDDLRMEKRLTPNVEGGRADMRRHLINDLFEQTVVEVADLTFGEPAPLWAHDAAKVAGVRGFEIHAVWISPWTRIVRDIV